ncbi:hypothetical protein DICPUDRAFT_158639 [Dictyostelium purpureum]|uniref:Uncharacterized protein n=1 Tax=Dictyostelium purpureum TaxID=5786 RepID=F1A244_DICPU|nr:uncharacterized protein DICPUDRAFT_158639 [Dictyostelium purpureum]EGC29739.1 hypothetical protein DICPUDRAFT_158639 [Dictyostelium purpureum]|eukprot:XP_003293732.1 hypothetical protein DICPUDRAFT_158639 [Dictyostelium purpureum]
MSICAYSFPKVTKSNKIKSENNIIGQTLPFIALSSNLLKKVKEVPGFMQYFSFGNY